MKLWLILFISLSLISCIGAPPKKKLSREFKGERRDMVQKFNQAYDLLGEENFSDAAYILEELEEKATDSQLRMIIKFNLASSYEGMGKCKKAGRRYRELSRRSAQGFPKIGAESLLRLSYCYECLGAYEKVASTLLEAWQKKSALSTAKTETEIPARLGMAYMRIGETRSAKKFFRLADLGIKKLPLTERQPRRKLAVVSQALFFMGKPEFRSFKSSQYKTYLKAIDYQQRYLLQAVELDDPKWSVKAAKELLNIYKFMARVRDEWPLPKISDQVLARKKRLSAQKEFSTSIITKIESLKKLKFPDAEEPIIEQGLFREIDLIQNEFQSFIEGQYTKTPLTPEARKRQRLKYYKPKGK